MKPTLMSFEEYVSRFTWPFLRDRVNKHIRDLVRESPDFVYTNGDPDPCDRGCFYSKGDGGGCIIGQAFAREGVDVSKWDPEDMEEAGDCTIEGILHKRGIKCPLLWTLLQAKQDGGQTWFDSFAEAAIELEEELRNQC